jgi:hypothetical protein
MPARVVDSAIYLSDKIRGLKEEYRAEYSYLLPMAEANGVFEADPDKIWAVAYSFHRKNITPEIVQDILADMKRVDLLRTWEERGKVWGFWTGIDKAGRLPSKKHLDRYKNLPPSPPYRVTADEGMLDESEEEMDESQLVPD